MPIAFLPGAVPAFAVFLPVTIGQSSELGTAVALRSPPGEFLWPGGIWWAVLIGLAVGAVLGWAGRGLAVRPKPRTPAEPGMGVEETPDRARRFESLASLAGGMAHDFNNILVPIFGHVDHVRRHLAKDSPFDSNLARIRESAERARVIVDQVLIFSQRGAARRSDVVDIDELVREVLTEMESLVPTHIAVTQHVAEEIGTVLGDRNELRQTVVNLVNNALDSMKHRGGVLEVLLYETELPQGGGQPAASPQPAAVRSMDPGPGYNPLACDELKPGRYIQLSVKDDGHGIDPRLRDRIYEPFFSTKDVGEGSGLGLAVVCGVVRNHGGGVAVDSEVGVGTSFHVYLPVAPATAVVEPIVVVPSQARTGRPSTPFSAAKVERASRRPRVLLVDDEPAVLEVTKLELNELGLDVQSFVDVVDALRFYEAAPDQVDLVLTDHAMPTMSGLEFAQRVRSIDSELPIVVTSGFTTQEMAERLAEVGVQVFLPKPYSMDELAFAVRKTRLRAHVAEGESLGFD